MKWQLEQRHWPVFLRNNIAIILAAILAFYLSWFVTLSYSVKGGLAGANAGEWLLDGHFYCCVIAQMWPRQVTVALGLTYLRPD
jgi:hypothetical protein